MSEREREVLSRLAAAALGAEPIGYAGREREIMTLRRLLEVGWEPKGQPPRPLTDNERMRAEARLAALLGDEAHDLI